MKSILLSALLALVAAPAWASAASLAIPAAEAERIGKLLWRNECGGTVEGLTSWNPGEHFASLGIGHFIWYPAGADQPFEESFPALLAFIRTRGTPVPGWLQETAHCPWPTRAAFLADNKSERMVSLRTFLKNTVGLQALFAAQRLESALPKMTAGLPSAQQQHVRTQFERMTTHPHGIYCLVDYVNFKGEGVRPTERHQNQGWGLLQVLNGMSGTAPGAEALREFSSSATEVLRQRVRLSPPERGEQRWLAGWENRCRTYLPPP
jgi:hypothetical protein